MLPGLGASVAPYFLAAFASAGGLATGLAATLGAALAHLLATRAGLLVATQLLSALGALGRITAALLGLRILRPDAEATT